MININFFKNNKNAFSTFLSKRNFTFDYDYYINLNNKIRNLKTSLYLLKREYNLLSNLYLFFKSDNFLFNFFVNKTSFLKKCIINIELDLKSLLEKEKNLISSIPNVLNTSVPLGNDSRDNLEVRVFNNSLNMVKNFSSYLLNDFELNKHFIDFDLSSKISGSGFVILKDSLCELHRAIGNYMLDKHILYNGYEEIYSPVLVKYNTMYNSGHFPKFLDDQFSISDSDLWLIPTAEVVLTNLIANSILNYDKIPLKFVSKTLCFRKEKGSYGYLVKGIIRQHQFDKVELVQVVDPSNSYNSLEELVYNAEGILQDFDLPYRVLLLCSGDTGFTSSKTYDLEVWLPKRKIYLEVSSCSNTEDFQSRRMNAKMQKNKDIIYPHVLNGSGLAIGRILLAIIENYSDSDGNINIPKVLIKYMNGKDKLFFT